MEVKELVKALQQYSQDLIAFKLDAEFAYAVDQSASAMESMQEELDRVKAERDAAVEDLECLMKATWYCSCQFCDPCNRSCAVKSKKDRVCRPKWRGLEGRTSHE